MLAANVLINSMRTLVVIFVQSPSDGERFTYQHLQPEADVRQSSHYQSFVC